MVDFVEYSAKHGSNWEFSGGCYKGGDVGYYEDAVIGESYDFADIPIEVREDESVVTMLENEAGKGEVVVVSVLGWLSSIFFFLSGLLLVVFVAMYVMALNSMRGGSSMQHKPQVDDH